MRQIPNMRGLTHITHYHTSLEGDGVGCEWKEKWSTVTVNGIARGMRLNRINRGMRLNTAT